MFRIFLYLLFLFLLCKTILIGGGLITIPLALLGLCIIFDSIIGKKIRKFLNRRIFVNTKHPR